MAEAATAAVLPLEQTAAARAAMRVESSVEMVFRAAQLLASTVEALEATAAWEAARLAEAASLAAAAWEATLAAPAEAPSAEAV